jgi:NAD(P)-dependent dehydrogenase (short-subunit alcohol dehydrogenase family)
MKRYPEIPLDGALVAITGGGRGIGLSTAEAFVAAGSRVAIGDLDARLAHDAADRLSPAASGHDLDVSERQSFATFLLAAESQHGRPVDILVNNAGIMPTGAFLDHDEALARRTMDVNLFGVVNGMALALPGMVERGRGHVVNVVSLAGKFPIKGMSIYGASKHAAVGVSGATRVELENTGVSVSVVLPSAVRTELSSGIDFGSLPVTEPDEVAAAVLTSVRTRAAEIAIPRSMGIATKVTPLFPEPMVRFFRRVSGDDAALNKVDAEQRRAYLDRIRGG